MRRQLICLIGIFVTLGCSRDWEEATPGGQESLQLLTFNIRYGTANDGEHAWPARKRLVAEVIERVNPDVLAIQEALDFQLDDLAVTLADYQKIGVHRRGGSKGEFAGLYVRKSIPVFESGTFWLSETPDVVGSQSWDAALPRTAAFVKFRWDGNSICVIGTHFDHRGENARNMSAQLILKRAPKDMPVIVMGDFNAEEGDRPMAQFASSSYESVVSGLIPESKIGTFNGFKDPHGGSRIDHILLFNPDSGQRLEMRTAAIHDEKVGELFPSDHFPVSATFSFGE